MSKFHIAESKTFEKILKKIDPGLYLKLRQIVYPQLKENPYFGPNIKKIKGGFEKYYRFKIGNYRLFYLAEEKKVLVVIVDLKHRLGAYKKY